MGDRKYTIIPQGSKLSDSDSDSDLNTGQAVNTDGAQGAQPQLHVTEGENLSPLVYKSPLHGFPLNLVYVPWPLTEQTHTVTLGYRLVLIV